MRSLLAVRGVALGGAVLLALVAPLPGIGQTAIAADDTPTPSIVVVGEGSVDVAPDMAVLVLTVSRDAPTAREALTANSAAMNKVLDGMAKLGIAKRDLQTSNVDIQPRYNHPQPINGAYQAPQLVGYTVRNSLTVRVRDIARVGEVLDTSVTLGINEGGSIQLTNDDPSAALAQARAKAVQDALAKAHTLAEAAGVKVGRILLISDQNFSTGPMNMMTKAMGAMAQDRMEGSVPITSGENTYRVVVNMTLALEQ